MVIFMQQSKTNTYQKIDILVISRVPVTCHLLQQKLQRLKSTHEHNTLLYCEKTCLETGVGYRLGLLKIQQSRKDIVLIYWEGIILYILTYLCYTNVHCTYEKTENQIDCLQSVESIRRILKTSREFQLNTVKIRSTDDFRTQWHLKAYFNQEESRRGKISVSTEHNDYDHAAVSDRAWSESQLCGQHNYWSFGLSVSTS